MDNNTLVCVFFFFYNATRAITCSYKYLLGKMLNKNKTQSQNKSCDLRVLELLATLNKTNFTVHLDASTSEESS